MSRHSMRLVFGVVLVAATAASAQPPQQATGGRNLSEMRFAPIPGLPTCAEGALQTGDPATSAFIMLVRSKAGCTIPWHWHTANEHLMIVSGVAEVTMRDDGKPVDVKSGGFALMPAKHVHNFRCKQACTLYLYSDGKFDIHYVDRDGNEIPPATALAPFRETVATAKAATGHKQ